MVFATFYLVLCLPLVFGFGRTGIDVVVEQDIGQPSLAESLQFITSHLLNVDRPASRLLEPPLTKQAIKETLAARGLSASNDIYEMYQISNGIDLTTADHVLQDLWILPSFYIESLTDAAATADMLADHPMWRPSWLPILASGTLDFIVVDAESGAVFEALLNEYIVTKVAANVTSYFNSYAQRLRQGKILLSTDGLLTDVDDARVDLPSPCPPPPNNPPNLNFNCGNMQEVCNNMGAAVNQGKPRLLCRSGDTNVIAKRRRQACRNVTPLPPGESCDEYPFASTEQGGEGAITRVVPLYENSVQGGQLSAFYTSHQISNAGDASSWFRLNTP